MTDIGEPYALTATEALRLIEAGSLSAVRWVASCQERIRDREPEIRAWASLDERVVEEVEARGRQGRGSSAETRDRLEGFMDELAAGGARLVDVQLEREIPRLLELHRVISGYEFRRSIAFERIHYLDRLSPILREGRLAEGHGVGNGEYQSAVREVAALRAQVAQTFAEMDILVSPSAAGPAPATLETTGEAAFGSAWTLAGNPAITLPLFRASAGLPIGCQLVAGLAEDDRLLAASKGIMDAFGPG